MRRSRLALSAERRSTRRTPKQPTRPCIGCGEVQVEGRTYCPVCWRYVQRGIPLDLVGLPKTRDAHLINAPAGHWDVPIPGDR